MEQNGPQTIATFTGTLLRRERHPVKRIVKLIFRENGQDWLCVSSNPATAKLDVGKNYRIQGVYKQVGEHAYIHEPAISLVKPHALAIKVVVITAIVVILGGGTAAGFKLMPSSKPANYTTPNPSSEALTAQPTVKEKTTEVTTPPPATTATPQPTPTPARTTTKLRTTARTTSATPTPTPQPTLTPAPTPSPTPAPADTPPAENPSATTPTPSPTPPPPSEPTPTPESTSVAQ